MKKIGFLIIQNIVFVFIGFGMLIGGLFTDDYTISVGGLVLIGSSVQIMNLCEYIYKKEGGN